MIEMAPHCVPGGGQLEMRKTVRLTHISLLCRISMSTIHHLPVELVSECCKFLKPIEAMVLSTSHQHFHNPWF